MCHIDPIIESVMQFFDTLTEDNDWNRAINKIIAHYCLAVNDRLFMNTFGSERFSSEDYF